MDVITSILVTTLLVATYIIASVFVYPMLAGGAGYTRTPKNIIIEALRLVDLKRDEVFYDLGCGTGEVLIEASKLCDHVKGVEIEPVRWFIARLRARKAQVILGNLFKRDISDADVIFIFQYRGRVNNRIGEKIVAGTRRGTRIISYHHPIENMKLIKSEKKIFIYRT